METQQWIDKGYNLIVEFAPKIIAAILIWIIGSWIIKVMLKVLRKTLNKGDYDEINHHRNEAAVGQHGPLFLGFL